MHHCWGVVTLIPRVVVYPPSTPLQPDNAFSVTFDISNNSVVSLNDVNVKMAVSYIWNTGPNENKIIIQAQDQTLKSGYPATFSEFSSPPGWQHHHLGTDERFTISPEEAFGLFKVDGAEILFAVEYKPWLIPFRTTKKFRFITRMIGGKMWWKSWPLTDPHP